MGSEEGFTLVEILVCVSLMSIMAGVMTLSPHAANQTLKREAEKVAAYFMRLTQKSDRIKVRSDAEIIDNVLNVFWNNNRDYLEKPFEISEGLKYRLCNCDNKLTYDYNNFPGGAKISVIGDISNYTTHKYLAISSDNNSYYYVLITDKDKAE